ncbi:MAG TPA: hypothetical protein VGD40_25140 [Chryseosolibacter sp.]
MIYVFKTSVRTKSEVRKLEPHLNSILPMKKWNFDLEDCDRILRIEGDEDVVPKITDLLRQHEIHCEELQ